MNEDLAKNTPKKFAKESFNIIITGTLSAINPGLGIAYGLAVSFYANALELRKSKVEEWVSMIEENHVKLKKEVLESVEFQDAFVNSLESYIRLRGTLKRAMARKIFLGYATSPDLTLFQLERHNETIKNISFQAIVFLKFLIRVVDPIRLKRVQSEVSSFDTSGGQVSEDNIVSSVNRQQIISYAYDDWMTGRQRYRQVMVPTKENPKHSGITGSGAVYLEENELSSHAEALIELEALGIIWRRQYSKTEMQFGAQPQWFDRWDLTSFGREFIEYLEKANEEKQRD